MSCWIVGRGDPTIYVEPLEAMGAVIVREMTFTTEIEALRYGIMCEEDAIKPMRENLRDMKARLRKLERKAKP